MLALDGSYMRTPRSAFVAGVTDVAPMLPGFVPFGMIVGAAAIDAGIPASQTVVMSLLMYAGAAQLAAIELLRTGAPAVIVVFTALVINVRFMIFSASLAPHFRGLSTRWKWSLANLVVDSSYALSITAFTGDESTNKRWYFLGVALPGWLNWQLATVAGIVLGARIPDSWQLDFAVPLVFMALLFASIEDRATAGAALVAGAIAVVAVDVPFQAGVVVATIAGIAIGALVERQGY